jgi:hypothetical protein
MKGRRRKKGNGEHRRPFYTRPRGFCQTTEGRGHPPSAHTPRNPALREHGRRPQVRLAHATEGSGARIGCGVGFERRGRWLGCGRNPLLLEGEENRHRTPRGYWCDRTRPWLGGRACSARGSRQGDVVKDGVPIGGEQAAAEPAAMTGESAGGPPAHMLRRVHICRTCCVRRAGRRQTAWPSAHVRCVVLLVRLTCVPNGRGPERRGRGRSGGSRRSRGRAREAGLGGGREQPTAEPGSRRWRM